MEGGEASAETLDRIPGQCSDTCIISHANLAVSNVIYTSARLANTDCLATEYE
jgi:hypothetical protein